MSYSEKHKKELLEIVYGICDSIRGMPLNNELSEYLNAHYGTNTSTYQTLSRLLQLGVEEGWVAYDEIAGPNYRRGRLADPDFNTAGMSVESGLLYNVKGQYHCHTKGEINMIVPLERDANFCGTTSGWRVFEPMSEHFPTVKGKALIMFFLPDGAIEYKAPPSHLQ
ncbi:MULTISPECIES: 4-hydroxylaminobenzoate lyase [unclassified Serratia (in: enterobacteria)]|uniref:4-hydroxylaminobenzoate lyase n=1 Tax=unclassified Serratia (in: enterobacteria) TaxID=2647522 RepID=UPI0030766BBD